MGRTGLAIFIVGLELTLGSCIIFRSQAGSDWAMINPGGPVGTAIGVLMLFFGAWLSGRDRR